MDAAHSHDRFTLATPRFEMRRVADRAAWQEVRELRDRALRQRREIAEGEALADDGHDTAPNSLTFLLKRNGRVAGSTRASVSSGARRRPLPSLETFGREIEAAIGWNATIVEASLTVVDPQLPGDPREALFHLFKAHLLVCALENAQWLVTAVPESQIGFHRRMFNMEILSGSERYPHIALPRVLMGLAYHEQAGVLFKRIPLMEVIEDDAREFAASGAICFREGGAHLAAAQA